MMCMYSTYIPTHTQTHNMITIPFCLHFTIKVIKLFFFYHSNKFSVLKTPIIKRNVFQRCIQLCKWVVAQYDLWKVRTLATWTSYWQTSNYTSNKNHKTFLLKPFSYKVMTSYITDGYCFQTPGDEYTSKHNCYCIMTIASEALQTELRYQHQALAPCILATKEAII